MADEEQAEQHSTVDESAIRRNSTMSGMWDGMRKGAMAGGVAMVGLLGVGAFVGASVAGGLMSMPGWLGSGGAFFGPKGAIIGGLLGTVGTVAGLFVGGAMLPSLLTVAAVGLAVVGGAAAIGAVVGAVNGYSKAGDAVEIAHDNEHMSHERKQVSQMQSQQKEKQLELAEAKLMMERERLKAGGAGTSMMAASQTGLPMNASAGKPNLRGSGGFPIG